MKYFIVLIFSFFLHLNAFSSTAEQEFSLHLRAIGNELLLQMGDSTSRVLPVKQEGETYIMQIENEFALLPDLLIFSTVVVLEKEGIDQPYIIETKTCETKEVVHSFMMNADEQDQACQFRELPFGCYTFHFTPLSVQPIVEDVSNQEESSSVNWIIIGIVGCLILLLFLVINRRKRDAEINEKLVNVGQFKFDKHNMALNISDEQIELSGKETDLLDLLLMNESQTLKREYILEVVWGDEGDYVGRTLDVFISKLRKKLEADPSLKIVNIRGVGYRFVKN